MKNNIQAFPKKRMERTYELEICAGCHERIGSEGPYMVVVLPMDETSEKHIALCEGCYQVAESYNIF